MAQRANHVTLLKYGSETMPGSCSDPVRLRVPSSPQEHLDAEKTKALRASVVIVVGTRISKGMIPEIEQVYATRRSGSEHLARGAGVGPRRSVENGGGCV